jgi:RimJ/RimL family protein N-acetyltransferase
MTPNERELLTIADLGGVRIRHKHPEDAFDDYQWRRDPKIARFDGSEPTTRTFTEFFEQFERDRRFRDETKLTFSLEDRDGCHFGNVMYYNGDPANASVEVGITIAVEEYRGSGIGTAVMVHLLRHIWVTTPFRRVQLHTLHWNERAQRCFRRAGFQDTARVIRNGESFIRMETRREWWLMWDLEGRFSDCDAVQAPLRSHA